MNLKASYAQSDEDRIVESILSRRHSRFPFGTVVEIGAYDGDHVSNSKAFIEDGWSAVLVEPSPSPLAALLAKYPHESHRGVVVIGGVVVPDHPTKRLVWFYNSGGDALSTSEPESMKRWAGVKFSRMLLPAITVEEVLGAVPQDAPPVRYLSIDVEGREANLRLLKKVLSLWEWRTQHGPYEFDRAAEIEVICVERETDHESVVEIEKAFRSYGWTVESVTPNNVIGSSPVRTDTP